MSITHTSLMDFKARFAALVGGFRSDSPYQLVTLGFLALLGVLFGQTFIQFTTDDAAYFWTAGQTLLDGHYFTFAPRLRYYEAGQAATFMRQPLVPTLMAVASIVVGDTTFAAFLPGILAATAFPLVYFAALRQLNFGIRGAFIATALLYIFPIFQLKTLSTARPDPVFVLLLAATLYGFGRILNNPTPHAQLAFGIAAGLAVLTRPEGLVYTAPLIFVAVVIHRRAVWRLILPYAGLVTIWSALSLLVTGSVWYSGYQSPFSGVYDPSRVITHLELMWVDIGYYIEAVGGSVIIFVIFLSVISVLGSLALHRGVREWSPLLVLLVPIALNVGVYFSLLPILTYTASPAENLRHLSYTWVYLVPVLALGVRELASSGIPVALLRGVGYSALGVWIATLWSRAALIVQPRPLTSWQLALAPYPFAELAPAASVPTDGAVFVGYTGWRDAARAHYAPMHDVAHAVGDGVLVASVAILACALVALEYRSVVDAVLKQIRTQQPRQY